MKHNKYGLFLLVASALMMSLACLGMALDTEDILASSKSLTNAGSPQNQSPDNQAQTDQVATNQVPSDQVPGDQASTTSDSSAVVENKAPSIERISPNKEGPQKTGSTIVWTAAAYDPEGDKILYQFWLNGPSSGNSWKQMTNWSENNVWSWTTNPVDSGNNIIDVRVRDGYHSGPEGWDSHMSADYELKGTQGSATSNSMPALLSMEPSRRSPQDLGTTVTWTASAADSDGDTILYQYWLKGPSTEELWTPMTQWTTKNQWTWNTAQGLPGIHTIEIRVRDGYHAGSEGSDDFARTVYILRQSGIIK